MPHVCFKLSLSDGYKLHILFQAAKSWSTYNGKSLSCAGNPAIAAPLSKQETPHAEQKALPLASIESSLRVVSSQYVVYSFSEQTL